ncbi:MAG: hypothetical protein AB8B55_15835 [Mariniblastus sp.]
MKSLKPTSIFSGLCLVAAALTFSGCNIMVAGGYSFNYTGQTAQSLESGVFSEGVTQIEVVNKFGDVNVMLAQGDPGWTWDKEVWADSQQQADVFLDDLLMNVETVGDKQTWTILMPESSSDLNGVKSNLTFSLPADIKVKLENAHGNVNAENLTARVDLTNSHGNLKASNLADGSLKVRHGNVDLMSASGALVINNSHGNVAVTGTEGSLEVDGSHSSINIDNAQDVKVSSSHGKISAKNIHGKIDASNSHDSINISTFGDSVLAKATHGKIDIVVSNSNFKSVDAETTHDSIKLSLPASVSPAISMSTSHGDSKSEIGSSDSSPQKVTLKTSHGNIRINKSNVVAESVQ